MPPGGYLVFLLPTTAPFCEALLPAHPELVLIDANEQTMAARWSRWAVTLRRVPRTRPSSTLAEGVAEGVAEGSLASGRGASHAAAAIFDRASLPLFERASLRPDDARREAVHRAAAQGTAAQGAMAQGAAAYGRVSSASEQVLHPELLGKSSGARRRLARRQARSEAERAAGQLAGGYGSSRRAQRRQERNSGRGKYEQHVRERLAAIGAGQAAWTVLSWAVPVAGAMAASLLLRACWCWRARTR